MPDYGIAAPVKQKMTQPFGMTLTEECSAALNQVSSDLNITRTSLARRLLEERIQQMAPFKGLNTSPLQPGHRANAGRKKKGKS